MWKSGGEDIKPSGYKPQREFTTNGEKKPTILGFYCSWGNGHKAAMRAMADSLGEEYHVATVDLPQTALLPIDTVHNLAGGDHTITSMYNTLVAGRFWKWITMLRNSGAGPSDDDSTKKTEALIREQILKQRPDIVMIDYGAHAPYVLKVCQELGLPFLRVCTDMDVDGDDLDTYSKPQAHFKKLIPYNLEEVVKKLKTYYRPGEVEISGYPTHPLFYKLMEQIKSDPSKLAELRKKYGVKEDEVVYMVSNGGCGSDNPFPELFAQTKKGQVPKGHVFVLTGNNKTAKEYLEKYLKENPKNPDLTFHIEGFISEAEKMAELVALAAASANGRRGLFIGKGGGGSVAEALCMGAQMLLDMRENNELPWEIYAAKEVKKRNLGDILEKEEDFVRLVNERTGAPNNEKDYEIFREKNPEKELNRIVKQMLKDAKDDTTFSARKTAWLTDQIFTRAITSKGEILNYFDSLNTLNRMLKDLDHVQLTLSDQAMNHLKKREPTKIDFEKMELVPADQYDRDEARLAVRYFINQLEKRPVEERLLKAASHYLDLVHLEHHYELIGGLNGCKRNPFMMEIAYLDRLIAAAKDISGNLNLADALGLYRTPIAKEQLSNWVNETLKHNRNKPDKSQPLLEERSAIRTFIKYPEHYNWLTDLHIHRLASTFNHQLSVNDNGEVELLFNGQKHSVSTLISGSITSIGKRIVDSVSGKEYTYHYEKGLVETTDETHPDHWKSSLPLFKNKKRNTEDYRLEIITDTSQDGTQEHAWIKLKSPNGDVYCVGRVWDPDVAFPQLEKTVLLPGHLRAADTFEFKNGNFNVTKINLENLTNFNKVKHYIEELQKGGDGYNLINHNSVSFVAEVCKMVGIDVESKVTMTEYFMSPPLFLRKFFILRSWTRNMGLVLSYPATLISHLVLGIFGAFKRHFLTSPNTKPLFYSVESFFESETSLVSSAYQLEAWQSCVKDELGTNPINLSALQDYARKISRAKLIPIVT